MNFLKKKEINGVQMNVIEMEHIEATLDQMVVTEKERNAYHKQLTKVLKQLRAMDIYPWETLHDIDKAISKVLKKKFKP